MRNKYGTLAICHRGFTLIEVLVALAVTSLIMIGTYSLIIVNQKQHLREDRLRELIGTTRSLETFLCDDFRSAGAILSMLHTRNYLGKEVPFNGIQPLNNSAYPDGVILAAGDPDATTILSADWTPGGSMTLDPTNPGSWDVGDIGLVMTENGYYIFRVTAVAGNVLSLRNSSVYHSGLLQSAHFNDYLEDQLGYSGDGLTYQKNNPVVRLSYFRIYLVRTEADGSQTLTVATDCEGTADIEDNESDTIGIPLVENVFDFQIDYVTQDQPPQYWASLRTVGVNYPDPCSDPGSEDCISFRRIFTNRTMGNARIFMMTRSAEDPTRRPGGADDTIDVPLMGDVAARDNQPRGHFHYHYQEYDITLRNFRIVY